MPLTLMVLMVEIGERQPGGEGERSEGALREQRRIEGQSAAGDYQEVSVMPVQKAKNLAGGHGFPRLAWLAFWAS